MAEEKHQHHHLFHHHKEPETPQDFEKEKKHHKHLEELGGLGAMAAGAYALVKIFTHILILDTLEYLINSGVYVLFSNKIIIKNVCQVMSLLKTM